MTRTHDTRIMRRVGEWGNHALGAVSSQAEIGAANQNVKQINGTYPTNVWRHCEFASGLTHKKCAFVI